MKAKILKDIKEFNISIWDILDIEISKNMPEEMWEMWKYHPVWPDFKKWSPLLKAEDVEILWEE